MVTSGFQRVNGRRNYEKGITLLKIGPFDTPKIQHETNQYSTSRHLQQVGSKLLIRYFRFLQTRYTKSLLP